MKRTREFPDSRYREEKIEDGDLVRCGCEQVRKYSDVPGMCLAGPPCSVLVRPDRIAQHSAKCTLGTQQLLKFAYIEQDARKQCYATEAEQFEDLCLRYKYALFQ